MTQTATYGYDANGNATWRSEGSKRFSFTWDFENRLTRVGDRKRNVTYLYDALGRRVERNLVFGRERTKYTYDGEDVLVDNDAGTLTKYINGPGIDNKLRVQTGSSVNYFLADHLGSTNGLADPSGAVVNQTSYDSFGNPTGNLASRYQFTGREYDSFTGQHYYRARFYDANLGRFISEDPIGFDGGINQYSYVRNNPTSRRDPMGLYEEDVHYYLTYYLAKRNGCFSDIEARIIAFGNQSTDDLGSSAPGYDRIGPNSSYHALDGDSWPGVNKREKMTP